MVGAKGFEPSSHIFDPAPKAGPLPGYGLHPEKLTKFII